GRRVHPGAAAGGRVWWGLGERSITVPPFSPERRSDAPASGANETPTERSTFDIPRQPGGLGRPGLACCHTRRGTDEVWWYRTDAGAHVGVEAMSHHDACNQPGLGAASVRGRTPREP